MDGRTPGIVSSTSKWKNVNKKIPNYDAPIETTELVNFIFSQRNLLYFKYNWAESILLERLIVWVGFFIPLDLYWNICKWRWCLNRKKPGGRHFKMLNGSVPSRFPELYHILLKNPINDIFESRLGEWSLLSSQHLE